MSKCILCDKEMEMFAVRQPYGGGEIQFYFAYGSCKFDWALHVTTFRGLICDECAEPLTKKMECNVQNPWEGCDDES